MNELSLHILDICNNSLEANASLIKIVINEDWSDDKLEIEINDNGTGMSDDILARVSDPFYTSRTVRKVGMGIPLLNQQASSAGGSVSILSGKGEGTTIKSVFRLQNIDRQPMGDLAGVIILLAAEHKYPDIYMSYTTPMGSFEFDTRVIKKELEIDTICGNNLRSCLREMLEENLQKVGSRA